MCIVYTSSSIVHTWQYIYRISQNQVCSPHKLCSDKCDNLYSENGSPCIYEYQGCKSVSSIGGWSPYFGDLFDIGGMILRFLFLMTFFFARQAFFSPFFVKIQLFGGDGGQILGGGGGICSPDEYIILT